MLSFFRPLRTHANRLGADRRGVTAIEYAVLAGAVATALVAVFSVSGKNAIFDNLQRSLSKVIDKIPTPK